MSDEGLVEGHRRAFLHHWVLHCSPPWSCLGHRQIPRAARFYLCIPSPPAYSQGLKQPITFLLFSGLKQNHTAAMSRPETTNHIAAMAMPEIKSHCCHVQA